MRATTLPEIDGMSAVPQKTVRLRASGGKTPKAAAADLPAQPMEEADVPPADPTPAETSPTSGKVSASAQPRRKERSKRPSRSEPSGRRKAASPPLPNSSPVSLFVFEHTPYGRVTPEYVIECLKEVVRKSLDGEDGKFNPAGANKALELLGRCTGLFGGQDGFPIEAEQGPRIDVSGLSPKQLMQLAKAVFAGEKK